MSSYHYLLFFICASLYVVSILFFMLTKGDRCIYCNRSIKVVRHEHCGAPICEECWKRIHGVHTP